MNKKFGRVILFIALFIAGIANAQVDSLTELKLDALSVEELAEYYKNLPEPEQWYKGPTTGDSLFYQLLPEAAPLFTVNGEPLHIHKWYPKPITSFSVDIPDTAHSAAYQKMQPKLSLGAGSLAFHGDLFDRGRRMRSPLTGKAAMDLSAAFRLNRFLQVNFNFLVGQLGVTESNGLRRENFRSEIRAGGVFMLYDFGNFISDKYRVRPFIGLGIYGFEFLSKTDIMDLQGRYYYYWSDGSIRSMAEGSAGSQNAIYLNRDYRYESDIRELNRDGFGKYRERAWAFPISAGFVMRITDRVDMRMNFQYFPTTTDYIDGISANSLGLRAGTKGRDKFSYTSITLQYDLIVRKRSKLADTLSDAFWLALDRGDLDGDGVVDLEDDCHGTPKEAKVDLVGCPLDDDLDGVPNYRDDELNSPLGAAVSVRGVTLGDDYWKKWYDQYMNDSIPTDVITEDVTNFFLAKKKKKKKTGTENDLGYTVELARYSGSIPTEDLSFLLSVGDINSSTMSDGTTVVYTTGTYEKLSQAVARRNEFIKAGHKAGISKVAGGDIVKLGEEEITSLLGNEGVSAPISEADVQSFGPDDIVYRVQLGAYRNKISTNIFNTSAGSIVELKTGESLYRYVTKGYKTIEEAAAVRADLVMQGYSDAFVTAYKSGKRIPMSSTKATVEKDYKEDLNEDKVFSTVDKRLVIFKVQLGPLKRQAQLATMDAKVSTVKEIEKQVTASGSVRYMVGSFSNAEDAENFRKKLESEGFSDAFVIATFKGDIISMQEAADLLR